MSVIFTKESENLFVIHIKGIFTFEDLKEFENKARAEIDRSRKVKLLILAEQLSDWGKEGNWGDLTFMYEYDPYVEKIAVVADEKWRSQIIMFIGVGRRQASVGFFVSGKEEDARDWLRSESV
ncbi:MAG: SpoIIAA family protein [Planctomycetota bacterium]